MPLNNPEGRNQYGEKNYPPDDVLRAALLQYARERLPRAKRVARLQEEHGLVISISTLKNLNKKFDIPSVRDDIPIEVHDSRVLNAMADDPNAMRGVDTIRSQLSGLPRPILVPRDIIRKVMRSHSLASAAARFPGARRGRPARKTLLSIGPNEMHHADGWEKLGPRALQMGGVGIPAYGFTDQCSSKRLYFVVVPNARLADVIVHVQLDFVLHVGGIAVTHVVDKGSELGVAIQAQREMRRISAPLLSDGVFPTVVQLSSFKNTPQEGAWHWLRVFDGYNLKDLITKERDRFNAVDDFQLQVCLFYWIWPPIVQQALDQFVQYWNCHRIRVQAKKANPSGETPNHVYAAPLSLGLRNCLIKVQPDVVQNIRAQQVLTRDQALSFCSASFDAAAHAVHAALGSPVITKFNAWEVFWQMLPLLRELYGDLMPEKATVFTL